MPSLAALELDSLYTMMKGEPGTRKSTAALSYPTPQYWFSTDQKMNSLVLPGKNFGTDFSQVDYDDYDSWDPIRKKLEQLQVNCKYKTIIIDSITSVGDAINSQVKDFKSGTTRADGSEKGGRVGGIPINTMEDYKAEASAFAELISLTKDIKKFHKVHIILIAHVIGAREPKTKEAYQTTHQSRIIITGGQIISGKIASYCEEAYHFNVEADIDMNKGGKYAFLTEHAGNDYARTCLPLPSKVIFGNEPVYDKFVKPAIEKLKAEKSVTRF